MPCLEGCHCNFLFDDRHSTFRCCRSPLRRYTGSGKGGQCWPKPACRPRPRRPTSTRRQAGWQVRRHASGPCLCWWSYVAIKNKIIKNKSKSRYLEYRFYMGFPCCHRKTNTFLGFLAGCTSTHVVTTSRPTIGFISNFLHPYNYSQRTH